MALSACEQNKPVAIPVKPGNRTFFIKITDIAFLKAEDKYVTLHTKEGKTHLLEQSLNYFEDNTRNWVQFLSNRLKKSCICKIFISSPDSIFSIEII